MRAIEQAQAALDDAEQMIARMEQEHEVVQRQAELAEARGAAQVAEARGQALDLVRQTGELAALRRQAEQQAEIIARRGRNEAG